MNTAHEGWATWKRPETLTVYAPPQICIEHLLLLTPPHAEYQFAIAYHHSAGCYTYQVCTMLAQEMDGQTRYHPISMVEGKIVPDNEDARCSRVTLHARSQRIPIGLMARVAGPLMLAIGGLLLALSVNQAYWSLIISISALMLALVWMMIAKRMRRIDTRGVPEICEHIRELQWKSLYVQDAIFTSANDYARHLQAQNVR